MQSTNINMAFICPVCKMAFISNHIVRFDEVPNYVTYSAAESICSNCETVNVTVLEIRFYSDLVAIKKRGELKYE